MKENLRLTTKDQQRSEVVSRWLAGIVTTAEAVALLGTSERTAWRLRAAMVDRGAAGIAHGNRGRASPRRLPAGDRARILELARTEYRGYNDTHLAEALAEDEGIVISRPALRRLLRGEGMASPRRRRAPRCAVGGAILAAAFVLAGCAGGGASGPSTTAPPSAPAIPTAAPPAAPSLTPVPQASASAGATSCVSLNIDYGPDARGKAGDLVDLARTAIAGLQTGDVVERDVPADVGSGVRIVRAGEVIGTLVYFPDGHGGWLPVSGYLCGGLGFKS